MNLTPMEYERIQYLLGMERFHHALTRDEAAELRSLLAKEDPVTMKLEWEGLIQFGLVFVGVTQLIHALSARSSPP